MADISVRRTDIDGNFRVLLHDNGDGTYSEYNGATIGSVTLSPTNLALDATVAQATPTVLKTIAALAVTANTPSAAIWTPTSGKKFVIMGWQLSLSVAGSVILKYGSSHTEFARTPTMAALIGIAGPNLGGGIAPGANNDTLQLDVTASGSVSGIVWGREV
jgi:hypothetical protein